MGTGIVEINMTFMYGTALQPTVTRAHSITFLGVAEPDCRKERAPANASTPTYAILIIIVMLTDIILTDFRSKEVGSHSKKHWLGLKILKGWKAARMVSSPGYLLHLL
jgi:hypothetical protein